MRACLGAIPANFIFKPSEIPYNYFAVDKSELYQFWGIISTELNKALSVSPDDNISLDHVKKVVAGVHGTDLYIVEDFQNEYQGFFIVQIYEHFGVKTCHIWLVGAKFGLFDDVSKMIFNVSRHNKCSKITCSSNRPAMNKFLEQFGMKPKSVSYEMEI